MTARISPAALDALVANHRRFLDFVAARVGSHADAEEILQDAFLRGLERGGALRDDESAVAWFYRVLRNAIVDRHRHAGAEARALERHAEEPSASPIFDEELERAACECVLAALEGLKPEYAEVLRKADVEEVEVREVPRAAGLTPGNARVRLHRARRALRREVERTCRTCAIHGCLDCPCGRQAGV